ncbi:hypothetical protein M3J09_007626 [Ascochyta lentis]
MVCTGLSTSRLGWIALTDVGMIGQTLYSLPRSSLLHDNPSRTQYSNLPAPRSASNHHVSAVSRYTQCTVAIMIGGQLNGGGTNEQHDAASVGCCQAKKSWGRTD